MDKKEKISSILRRIDGRGYKAYLDLKGAYNFDDFILYIDHVQRDPFANPSILRAEIKLEDASFPLNLLESSERIIALEDYIARLFRNAIHKYSLKRVGSGNSGVIKIDAGDQEVLERSCVNIGDTNIEIRFQVGLPARGRRIIARESKKLLLEVLPRIIEDSCYFGKIEPDVLVGHVNSFEDANAIRQQLGLNRLVAFIADGSVLPRKSGVSDKPLKGAVQFKSPNSLKIELETPNSGLVSGMGVPEGVTLIVGGGYHGKSTLLRAVELGVYNHIPDDGREMVVTRDDAFKIRAEDGRPIVKVDIRSFIHKPPGIGDTGEFSTTNASGSTSQAANIIETLETGSKLLLFDEDTSATNFMIRDERMQRLVSREREPITPFIDRVRELYQDHGVSTIMVMGGSGDYFEVADTVIMMDSYHPYDVTSPAYKVAEELPINRVREVKGVFDYAKRSPVKEGINLYKGRKLRIDNRGLSKILLGKEVIDLKDIEQLVSPSQTRAISYALYKSISGYMGPGKSIDTVLDLLEDEINSSGLDFLAPPGRKRPHNLARPRRYEIAAALNRLRTLQVGISR